MDSSRTKDQAELRERIAEIQEELAWKSAEDEAEAQKKGLQEQLDAYDEYETEYQEYLDEYLEDANNFADEVNSLLGGSQEDLFAWLEENVEEYGNSLSEMQQQMIQGWQDTYDQMKDIIHTFWDEASEIVIDRETYVNFMMQNDPNYRAASDAEKELLKHQYGQQYDDWMNAKKLREEVENYEHEDPEEDLGSKTNNQYTSKTYYGGYDASGRWVTGVADTFVKANVVARFQRLSNVVTSTRGYPVDPKAPTGVTTEPNSPTGLYWVTTSDGSKLSSGFVTSGEATGYRYQQLNKYQMQLQNAQAGGAPDSIIAQIQAQYDRWNNTKIQKYSQGGYVDYTGLAMVHGSNSRPEAFLSAEDTALMRAMLDSWQFVLKRPTIYNVDSALSEHASGTSFGDISITITEASFADDADYEEVARRVGDAFTKELSRQGFRTSSFNF